MMGSFGLLALALTIAPVQEPTSFEIFQLFNSCEPMGLTVVVFDNDGEAKNIGLIKERVQFAVERRLRVARLFRSGYSLPFLDVTVGVVGSAFRITMGYSKMLFDSVSDREGTATTWSDGTFGTHGSNADFIVSSLSGLLDKFLTEYLRVNESACTESPQPPTQ